MAGLVSLSDRLVAGLSLALAALGGFLSRCLHALLLFWCKFYTSARRMALLFESLFIVPLRLALKAPLALHLFRLLVCCSHHVVCVPSPNAAAGGVSVPHARAKRG